jgi:hypothetical protein
MQDENLPENKTLILSAYNLVRGAESKTTPAPYTKAEILAESEVKEWLAKGYELEGFSDPLTDPFTRTVTIRLVRKH